MIKFHPALPESFKAGDVYKFVVESDTGVEKVVVSQEHPGCPVDEFIGKGTKKLEVKFAVNLATTSVNFNVYVVAKLPGPKKIYEEKRPVHWKD